MTDSIANDGPGSDGLAPPVLLGEAERFRRKVRRAGRNGWVAFAVLAVLTAGSLPLYAAPKAPGAGSSTSVSALWPLGVALGGPFHTSPFAVALYWLAGGTVGFVVVAAWYRLAGRRRGVAAPVARYVTIGVALLAALGVAAAVGVLGPGDLTVRGLLPLTVLVAAVLVLARAEHDPVLAAAAVVLVALSLIGDLYDLSNLTARAGAGTLGLSAPQVNVAAMAAGLAVAAAAVGAVTARRRS
ncbi:hypothetical protein GHK86_04370 [Acidimicrobiaceae bacterium USS-CC1]|uniref:Uncharacterized protein n=1 Tax=Acidiferrimicrobium australe TaxID=2664430 RepID=A0ABW9QRI5_9ACTN|nr:hypothetical protein [Acidiferrimicrobium australe]